jgi:hypothetical protein
MEFKQVLELLPSIGSIDDFGYGEIDTEKDYFELGKIEEIDNYGGEGMGDEYWRVYYLSKYDMYIKVEGYYQSYDGASFPLTFRAAFSQVYPKEVTKTIYTTTKP